MFNKRDKPLLKAFISREANDYPWMCEVSKKALEDRLWKEIYRAEPLKKINYVRIQSHSNMGTVIRELVLIPSKSFFDWRAEDVIVMLGASHTDPVRFHWVPATSYGLRNMIDGEL